MVVKYAGFVVLFCQISLEKHNPFHLFFILLRNHCPTLHLAAECDLTFMLLLVLFAT